MAENRGFGGSRSEGYKSAPRGGKSPNARGSSFGPARGGKDGGAVRSSSFGPARVGKDGGAANYRGGKPKDARDGKSADFRDSGSKPADSRNFKSAPAAEGTSSFRSTSYKGDRKEYDLKRDIKPYRAKDDFKRDDKPYRAKDDFKRDDKPYKQNEVINSRGEIQDSRSFAGDDFTAGYQGDLDKLEGRNSVLEALKAGRSINRIFIAKGDREGSISQIVAMARQSHILIQEIERSKLDDMSLTHSHQGVIALTAAKDYVEVDDILLSAEKSGKPPFIIILDEITDSYNLGSILRTANAAGVHGVIIPKRRAVGLTSAVSKASAGAIEYVPVARVTNIVQTIEKLKKQNIWVVGTDSTGEKSYFERDLTGSIALVIGSEGEGMGKLVRESCDFVVNIPMLGQISSLNAAVAGAIVTYEALRQRSNKLP